MFGGLLSGILGLFGANKMANTQAQATQAAMDNFRLGYDYLLDNELVQGAQTGGQRAQESIMALLGLGGDQAAAEQAFNQFRDSTGYQFRLGEGLGAIEGSQAAGGLLNSGATLKGLADYGQGMASAEFNNYLAQLLGQQETGLSAAYNVASGGESAGANVANAALEGAAAQNDIFYTGLANVGSGLIDMFGANQAQQNVNNYYGY